MTAFFILTDLEGPAGIDSFTQTRPDDGFPERVEAARALLTREVNACIEGIRSVYPDCRIDVWDGHGPGGLIADGLIGGTYLREGQPYKKLEGYTALLFVGQHAMAGTINGPLCHTYSSKTVSYYKLNGTFIGEFGARALIAGTQGVPTIFLSGDDKAALEARMFVPDIETAVVKTGHGVEAADHLSAEEACRRIKDGSAKAVRRTAEFMPFTGIAAPYVLEIGYLNPLQGNGESDDPRVERINDRTVRISSNDLLSLPI
ncbi:M55 family metallopeptidase [Paenibacillus spongiae]|uniref:M55 family metallopeptidase n=1 Tax=Paenibacillus spongiae TaxID=2909671 RepID=A0ABY5S4B3_9BACL|nr:M55 family metallopeptidase [Paenibacillus spongiae]UVI28514.1 M55 family metallopeptidase [Paenibacillus spongiae]